MNGRGRWVGHPVLNFAAPAAHFGFFFFFCSKNFRKIQSSSRVALSCASAVISATTGDIENLIDHLNSPFYVADEAVLPGGATLLHAAASSGQAQVIQILLEKGHDPNKIVK
jgi:hypothetical protein